MVVYNLLTKKPVRREKSYRPPKQVKLSKMIHEKTQEEILLDQYPELKVYWSNGYRFTDSNFDTMERFDS